MRELENSVPKKVVSGDWEKLYFRTDIMLALGFCFIRRVTFLLSGLLGGSTEGDMKKEML